MVDTSQSEVSALQASRAGLKIRLRGWLWVKSASFRTTGPILRVPGTRCGTGSYRNTVFSPTAVTLAVLICSSRLAHKIVHGALAAVRQAGRLVGRLVVRLVDRLVGWLAGWLAGWLVGCLVVWSISWLVGWLVGHFGISLGPSWCHVGTFLDQC